MVNSHPTLHLQVEVTESVPELLHAHWHRYEYSIYALEGETTDAEARTLEEGLVLDRPPSQWTWMPSPCDPVVVTMGSERYQGRESWHSSSQICESGDFSVTAAVLIRFLLPPKSLLSLHLPLTKAFAVRELHQTDASRGLDCPPAVVAYRYLSVDSPENLGSERAGEWAVVLAGSAIVTLPFPDASMPFNVITLVSEE